MAAPPHVPDLRSHRLLRQLAEPAREQARVGQRASNRSFAEPGEDWSWCYVDEVAFMARP